MRDLLSVGSVSFGSGRHRLSLAPLLTGWGGSFYRRSPVTTKSAPRAPHSVQRSTRAQSITGMPEPCCATCVEDIGLAQMTAALAPQDEPYMGGERAAQRYRSGLGFLAWIYLDVLFGLALSTARPTSWP